jgi:hypothetical protein
MVTFTLLVPALVGLQVMTAVVPEQPDGKPVHA